MKQTVVRVHRSPAEPRCGGVLLTPESTQALLARSDLEDQLALWHVSSESFAVVLLPRSELSLVTCRPLDVVVGREVRVCQGLMLPRCEFYHPDLYPTHSLVDCYTPAETRYEDTIWRVDAVLDFNDIA